MEINTEKIDIKKLRKDLIEHFTSAIFIVSPVAMMELTKVENASSDELVKIAISNKFDMKKYYKNY